MKLSLLKILLISSALLATFVAHSNEKITTSEALVLAIEEVDKSTKGLPSAFKLVVESDDNDHTQVIFTLDLDPQKVGNNIKIVIDKSKGEIIKRIILP